MVSHGCARSCSSYYLILLSLRNPISGTMAGRTGGRRCLIDPEPAANCRPLGRLGTQRRGRRAAGDPQYWGSGTCPCPSFSGPVPWAGDPCGLCAPRGAWPAEGQLMGETVLGALRTVPGTHDLGVMDDGGRSLPAAPREVC